jgi:hypothetical protein
VGNFIKTHRKSILEGKAATATNKMTGKQGICPFKSARLGINGLKKN